MYSPAEGDERTAVEQKLNEDDVKRLLSNPTGETRIERFERVERGYADVAARLRALGASAMLR